MPRKINPPCFSCGNEMLPLWSLQYTWKCRACDVMEERNPLFVSRVQTVLSVSWFGEDITYIDHSAEHYPSPG